MEEDQAQTDDTAYYYGSIIEQNPEGAEKSTSFGVLFILWEGELNVYNSKINKKGFRF